MTAPIKIEVMSDKAIGRSRRGALLNSMSVGLLVGTVSAIICSYFPESRAIKIVCGGIYLLAFSASTKYLTAVELSIKEYLVLREDYLATLHPSWSKKLKDGD